MARNRDLKDIQGAVPEFDKPGLNAGNRFEQAFRIYCPFRVYRLKWRAGYRDPAPRLGGHPSGRPFLGAMSIGKGIIRSGRKT